MEPCNKNMITDPWRAYTLLELNNLSHHKLAVSWVVLFMYEIVQMRNFLYWTEWIIHFNPADPNQRKIYYSKDQNKTRQNWSLYPTVKYKDVNNFHFRVLLKIITTSIYLCTTNWNVIFKNPLSRMFKLLIHNNQCNMNVEYLTKHTYW